MFTAVLRECNLLSPKFDSSSRKRKIWCHLFPHKSSGDQHQSTILPAVRSCKWPGQLMKKETEPEQVQYHIQNLSYFSKWLKNTCKTFTPGKASAFFSKICLNTFELLFGGPAQRWVTGHLRRDTGLAPTGNHRATIQCEPPWHKQRSSWWIASGFYKRQWPPAPMYFHNMLSSCPVGA